jgi:hypothetical protein
LSIEKSTPKTDARVDIIANALRKAFRTNAFGPWDSIARQAVQALDEQYVDKDLERDLDLIEERDELEAYIKGHELMMRYKQEIWNEGYRQGRRDAAESVRSAVRVSDLQSTSLRDTLIRAADGTLA